MKKTTIAFVNDEHTGVRWLDRNIFLYNLQQFAPGTKLKVTIEHYFPQRSLKQNGVLHWYSTELAEEAGMEVEDFKMMMKMRFLTRPVLKRDGEYMIDYETGEVMTYIPSTSDLDTAEMGLFIDKIRLFGIEAMGYELPLPDENYKIHFLETDKKRLNNG